MEDNFHHFKILSPYTLHPVTLFLGPYAIDTQKQSFFFFIAVLPMMAEV